MKKTYFDLFVEALPSGEGGYEVYGITSGGTITKLGEHYPWFSVNIDAKRAKRVESELLSRAPSMVHSVKTVSPDKEIPLARGKTSFVLDPTWRVVKVYTRKKEYVPQVSNIVESLFPGARVGRNNIVYPVRVAMDFNVPFFHPDSPLLFQPNSEIEALARETIELNIKRKIMSWDIEVYSPVVNKFPKPGSPVITIQYAYTTLEDDSFFDPSWIKENVVVLSADDLDSSPDLVKQFLREVDRIRPDFLVGYNSINFDSRYIRPFVKYPFYTFPDVMHIRVNDHVYPHIDFYMIVERLRSSLGLRSSQRIRLHDVLKEIVRKDKRLSWLLSSPYMMAEEKLDHSKIGWHWKNKTELFHYYVSADAYAPLVFAREWLLTIILLSTLTGFPITEISRLNTGQVAEFLQVRWLERLGMSPIVVERTKEFKKIKEMPENVRTMLEKLGHGDKTDLFFKGKVFVKEYGLMGPIVEGDFAQLYPTLMSNESVDPFSLRYRYLITPEMTFKVYDRMFARPFKIRSREFPVTLGIPPRGKDGRPRKNADYMELKEVYLVTPVYGPISFLIYKMFTMRRITKKLKKEAKDTGRAELLSADQAVKILNNATFGAWSKKRGMINEAMSAYVFWKSLKILLDVVDYAERELGLEVLYGDTDSIFIRCNKKFIEDRQRECGTLRKACEKWFKEEILPKLNGFVKEKYGKEFEIEFEDSFDYCIYPKQKESSQASRKTYICWDEENGEINVKVFKGEFYKALAPAAISEKLDEFYKEILRIMPKSEKEVEDLLRRFLLEAPAYKLFVNKSIESFEPDQKKRRRGEKGVLRTLKKLNKNFHYAGLHMAYVWDLDGVEVVKKKKYGNVEYVEYKVDADEVLKHGSIDVYFIPTKDPRTFYVYVDAEGDTVIMHRVKVEAMEKWVEYRDEGVFEKGYIVREKYSVIRKPKEQLVEDVVKAMSKYILGDIVKKMLPAIWKAKGGALDAYLGGESNG